MEVMFALKFCQVISWLVFFEADVAFAFWKLWCIISDLGETTDNGTNLSIVEVSSGSLVSKITVEAWSTSDGAEEENHQDLTYEQEKDHNN